MITTQLREIALEQIEPSGTNPRKDFTSAAAVAYLQNLAGTIRTHGVLQPALVRLQYCVGEKTHAGIVAARRFEDGPQVRFVLVCGECRLRASALAERATLPCIVRELTDDDAREAQTIENLQRRDISPLEEAQGFADMLELRDDAGKPRYTVAALAERIGHAVGYVYKRCELLKLPDTAKAALADGKLTAKVAQLITVLPTPDLRERFTTEILRPEFEEGPLSYSSAMRVRTEKFTVPLAGAPFKLTDAELLPAAGACAACPKMSGNLGEEWENGERGRRKGDKLCLDPTCHRAKLAALLQRQTAAEVAKGKTLLSEAETAAIYPPEFVDGLMAPESRFAEIGHKPEPHLLKKEVVKPPTWSRLIEDAEEKTGAKLPRFLARDQGHVVRELVDVKAAMALIEKAGEPIFRGSDGPRPAADAAWKAEQKAAKERAALARTVALAQLDAVGENVDAGPALRWLAPLLAREVRTPAGALLLCQRHGKDYAGDDGVKAFADLAALAKKLAAGGEPPAVARFVVEAALADALGAPVPPTDDTAELCAAYGLDPSVIAKAAKAKAKAAATPPKPAKLTLAEIETKVRELRRAKTSDAEIRTALKLGKGALAKLLKKIDGEEAAATATNDPKILKQWVMARAGGMSDKEIARSYKVSVADVAGALGTGDKPARPPKKAKATKAKTVRQKKGGAK